MVNRNQQNGVMEIDLLQLFRALGFRPPKYLHIGPLMKMDGDTKRKLSKRKDAEALLF